MQFKAQQFVSLLNTTANISHLSQSTYTHSYVLWQLHRYSVEPHPDMVGKKENISPFLFIHSLFALFHL